MTTAQQQQSKLHIVGSKVFWVKRNAANTRTTRKLIGELRKQDGKINLFKVSKEKDRLQKLDAWGINYDLFQLITGSINIKTEQGIYRIDKSMAQIWHRVMYFKEQGYEPQCFVPVSKFTYTQITQAK